MNRVTAATDHLLDLLTDSRDSNLSFRAIFCAIRNRLRLFPCINCPYNILRTFEYTIQKLQSTITTLSYLADALDDGLDGMENHLIVIRNLLADEAGIVMLARDEILGDPWHRLGRHYRRLRHYETRMQAIQTVKTSRDVASAYIAIVKGGLLRVEKELKVLGALAREPDLANSVLPMEVFVQALRTGVLRLHVAQSDLIGGETINDEGTLGLGQMMEDAQN